MVTRRQHGLTKNQGAVGEGLLDDKKNKKNAVNVVHLDFYKNILRQMEERELDTGNSKELVENYTQENSDRSHNNIFVVVYLRAVQVY